MVKILEGKTKSKDKKFAIVVSRFNEFITKKLLNGCLTELVRLGVKDNEITVAWVPGAFEIPAAALKFARKKNIDAVICLGAVIRGETTAAPRVGVTPANFHSLRTRSSGATAAISSPSCW